MASIEKFWSDLSTKTRNALIESKEREPWKMTIGELLRVPRIGPGAIEDIARATQKNWEALKPPSTIRRIANDR